MAAEPVTMPKIAADVKVSVENKTQVTSPSVDSTVAQNNCSRCLDIDSGSRDDDDDDDDDNNTSAAVYKPQNQNA